MGITEMLGIVVLLAVAGLTLAVYILALALKQVIDKNHSLASQILTLKAHTQSGPHAAAQVLRSQHLAGLASQKQSKKSPAPKEKAPSFSVKSSFI